MTSAEHKLQSRTMLGIGYAMAGFSVFSVQDAVVKWLVTSLPVWEVLCIRSALIVIIGLAITGPRQALALVHSPNRKALLIRSALILVAWLAYFTASRSLHLAELVTIYFSAPIFVVILSIFVLKETVGLVRWGATLLGFVGVVVAAGPKSLVDPLPIALTLLAAFCWAWTHILVRMISQKETTINMMLTSNGVVILVSVLPLPFVWVTPDLTGLVLIVGLGLVGALGQYLMFEGYRLAPASAVAPFEYITLLWAFGWGFLIWGDWPPQAVFEGAALILVSGLALIFAESLKSRRLARA